MGYSNSVTVKPQVVEAPRWLVERMEALRKMPRPALENVIIQLKASAQFRKKGKI